MSRYAIGIDTGGTFTDFVLIDQDNQYENYKTPSTPHDPSIGLIHGLRQIAASKSISLEGLMSQVDLIVHGTTVTTNAVLTEKGAKTALLTTAGFRDILEMRRGVRGTFYNNKYTSPSPLVPRSLRFTVEERVTSQGNILHPINEDEIQKIGEFLKSEQIEAVAVCFMHAYISPNHEKETKRILQSALPEVFITLSSEVLPQPRIYERTSTTVLNSYVGPILQRYLDTLLSHLHEMNFSGTLLIIRSNGGVASSDIVKQIPVSTLLSGPAAGPTASATLCQTYDFKNCITIDMGGTSFEASLIKDGIPLTSRKTEINSNSLSLPMMDIRTIGAGGGSIAWLDNGGFLHMGPQSSGAIPGPAAYNLDGTEPTCTDADLVLGYLDSNYFFNGHFPLSLERAYHAIDEKIAKPLGISVEEAAWGMYQVITTNMASSLKEITIKKGYDPREFLLIVGGGAGPLHSAMLAQELDIRLLLIPSESSVMCALGMLLSDLKYDYVRTFHSLWSDLTLDKILPLYEDMLNQAKADSEACRTQLSSIEVHYSIDLRYSGQHNELTLPFDREDLENRRWDNLFKSFHNEHNYQYGYSLEDSNVSIEILCLRLTYIGKRQNKLRLKPVKNFSDSPVRLAYRNIYLPHQAQYESVPVWDGTVPTSQIIQGPAVIEKGTSTILVPSLFSGKYDIYGNLFLYNNEKENIIKNMTDRFLMREET